MPQVSVIVLTYNADNAKLRQTLTAAAAQKDVELEIIISDDGSASKDFSFLPGFMESLHFPNYRLLEHETNRGTVQNCLSAVQAATGAYVFLTSPGDYLFDPYVLRDLYRFAQEQQAPLCFGNAVFYRCENGEPVLTREHGTPPLPRLYNPKATPAQVKTAFFGGQWVIGAAYFRSRQLALACMEQVSQTAIYMEDTPSTLLALATGQTLCYCDRNMVWYEDGTGVSTGASEKWAKRLREDLRRSLTRLKHQHPKNPYVDIAFRNITVENRTKRIAENLLLHPLIMLRLAQYKKAAPTPIHCATDHLQQLKALLKIQ